MMGWVILFIIIVIILFVISKNKDEKEETVYTIDNPPKIKQTFHLENKDGTLIGEGKFIEGIQSGDQLDIEIIPSGIFLLRDEVPLLLISTVYLFQEKTHTKYIHDHSGTSFRIAKGITFRTGSGGATRISSEYLDYIDEGELLITNLGMHFKGRTRSEKILFDKVLGILFRDTGITVNKTEHKIITLEGVDSDLINKVLLARKTYEEERETKRSMITIEDVR